MTVVNQGSDGTATAERLAKQPKKLVFRRIGSSQPPPDPPQTGGSRGLAVLPYLLIGAGILLRLFEYLGNRSLWLDEAYLALNIAGRSYAELLQPLDHDQVAPVGFLLLMRLVIDLFGNSEYSLRLLSLLAGCGSVFLFWAVARRVLSQTPALIALTLFAISPQLIYYSAEVKQYAIDVAVALLLLLLALEVMKRGLTTQRAVMLGAAGAIGVTISFPVVFIMAGLAAAFGLSALLERRWQRLWALGVTCALWAVSAGPMILLSRRAMLPETSAFQKEFWTGKNAFMPMPPGSLAEILWLPKRMSGILFNHGYPEPLVVVALVLFAVGCLWGFRNRPALTIALLVPAAAVLAASALEAYPFYLRTVLFLFPSFLLLAGAGVASLGDRFGPARSWAVGALAALLILPWAWKIRELPTEKSEIRPVIEYIAQQYAPGDEIYAYYWAQFAFRYHAPRFGFGPEDYRAGLNTRGLPDAHLREVEAYRDRGRTWFVFSHDASGERRLFLQQLDEMGVRIDEFRTTGAGAYLYDLRSDALPTPGRSSQP